MTKVTVIVSQKGGVGKTTLTVQLGATTAEAFPPMVPPDVEAALKRLDLAAPGADAQLRALLRQCKAQVLTVSTDPQTSLVDWLDKVSKVFWKAKRPLPLDYAQEDENPRVLAKLKTSRQYKRIFVDSPGWLPKGTDQDKGDQPLEKSIVRASLESADMVLLPLEPEDLAFNPLKRTIREVVEPLGIPYLVVINNWDPRDGTGDLVDTQKRVERAGFPLATTVVRRYKVHTNASAAGRLCTTFPKNRVSTEARTDFLKLAMEIAVNGGE
ncbi:ParA family protein [Amycolatopsis sp. NPDC058986]|uniref:ParA family protein n=1 Tax=unclassified Amycolatopsis TaxID=2618356 RepID=UPI00366B4CB0